MLVSLTEPTTKKSIPPIVIRNHQRISSWDRDAVKRGSPKLVAVACRCAECTADDARLARDRAKRQQLGSKGLPRPDRLYPVWCTRCGFVDKPYRNFALAESSLAGHRAIHDNAGERATVTVEHYERKRTLR